MLATSRTSDVPSLEHLLALLRGRRIVVLAGAGCSTESGIPDYRGPEGSLRTRKPIQYLDFVRSEAMRVRYWARSAIGWPRMTAARPNPAHRALAALEAAGVVHGVITQNVDGLHHAAGSRRVLELHGSLATVICLACGLEQSRDDYQAQLRALNPVWWERWMSAGTLVAPGAEADPATVPAPGGRSDERAGVEADRVPEALAARAGAEADRATLPAAGGQPAARVETAPDGDAELGTAALDSFRVGPCVGCGGVIKPDVVFFGENVPPARVQEAWRLFSAGEALLVVGSSLTVFSGRRFVHGAQKEGIPVAIVNLGPTRGDEVAAVKVEGRVGVVLPRIAAALAHSA